MTTKSEEINLFGKRMSRLAYYGLLLGYFLFMIFVLPLMAGGYFMSSGIVVMLPLAIPLIFYREVFFKKRTYSFLVYSGLVISSTIYVSFFVDASFVAKFFHYLVYFGFGYLWMKQIR